MRRPWLLAALAVASAGLLGQSAAAPEAELSRLFDSGRGGRPDPLAPFRSPTPAPRVLPRALPPPDLLEASKRWGNAAQAAKLLKANPTPKLAFRLAIIGDVEKGRFPWQRALPPPDEAEEKLLEALQGLGPDLVFQLGDFVSQGTVENYRERVRFLDAHVRLPLFSVIGNHDRSRPNGSADKSLYAAVFGKSDFFVDYNGWRLIGLDSSDRRVTRAQLDWLKDALRTPQRKIILTHVPPDFLKGKIKSCGLKPSKQEKPGKEGYWKDVLTGYFKDGSPEFGALVSAARVDRVYMGHIHAFGIAEHKGTRYVLSGSGGSPLYPLPPGEPQCKIAHFIEVALGPGAIRETVHELDGSSFDLP